MKTNYTGYFLKWLETENLQQTSVTYNDLLVFIDYCKEKGRSSKLINCNLRAIRNYYEYLKTKDEYLINPAVNLHLKGIKKKLPHDILSYETLEELYKDYEAYDLRTKRNRIILGLLIYQGVTTDELHRIKVNDIDLRNGKINVPGSKRSYSRKLELKSVQILELQEYINKIRPKLIGKETEQLIISIKGSGNVKPSLFNMFKQIKKLDPNIQNAKQIRSSIITFWLKNHNLRKVQYMSGHKYISSTERYQINNIESLQKQLDLFHPLN
jgi:integrase/recombinase XerD